MIIFLAAVGALIAGYLLYGRFVEKIFSVNEQIPTPAISKNDNVDYMVLPSWRVFLIQFLNIAGLGPVFGAILGALYGPVALLWIVFGSIFAGGVHDYMAGMISVRNGGQSLVPLVEKYLGAKVKTVFLVFMVCFLLFDASRIINSSCNSRSDILSETVTRGSILADGLEVLAYTQTDAHRN